VYLNRRLIKRERNILKHPDLILLNPSILDTFELLEGLKNRFTSKVIKETRRKFCYFRVEKTVLYPILKVHKN
jgi:hypothetical protein